MRHVTLLLLSSIPALFFFLSSTHGISHRNRLCKENLCRCGYSSLSRHHSCCCWGGALGWDEIHANVSRYAQKLILEETGVQEIWPGAFGNFSRLQKLIIKHSQQLRFVDAASFDSLVHLEKLTIENAPNLKTFAGTLLRRQADIISLSIVNTGIRELPTIEQERRTEGAVPCTLDLRHNQIEVIKSGTFRNLNAYQINLAHNHIEKIEDRSFEQVEVSLLEKCLCCTPKEGYPVPDAIYRCDQCNAEVKYFCSSCKAQWHDKCYSDHRSPERIVQMQLNNNPLSSVLPRTFEGIKRISTLDVSASDISSLPAVGLTEMTTLLARKAPKLKKLPPVLTMTKLTEAHLTYPYHCCLFKGTKMFIPDDENTLSIERAREELCGDFFHKNTTPPSKDPKKRNAEEPNKDDNSYYDEFNWWYLYDYTVDYTESPQNDEIHNSKQRIPGVDYNEVDPVIKELCTDSKTTRKPDYLPPFHDMVCTPQPDALKPCEDVMGSSYLRVSIWIVWILGLSGNSVVMVYLSMHRCRKGFGSRDNVHTFIMINIAFAGLLTGIYLAILAIIDLITKGEYYNFAVDWQTGWGCKAAGFMTVFASELTILSMLLISVEVWYNTKYSFYGYRMKYNAAISAMAAIYVISFISAATPLLGVNSYTPTSICLPLQLERVSDRVYLAFLLVLNLLAFLMICASYISIYLTVSGQHTSPTAQAQDIIIAKRMAILILTDFICWAPTVFFGLTATLNMPLISISNAKILLVAFYPINSCANPFLYVFSTKYFRSEVHGIMSRYSWWIRMHHARKRRRATPRLTSGSTRSTIMSFVTWTPRSSLSSWAPSARRRSQQLSADDIPTKQDLVTPASLEENQIDTLQVVLRQKPKNSRRYQPQMSAIVENSHSNSVDDNHSHRQSPVVHQPPPLHYTDMGIADLYDRAVETISHLGPGGEVETSVRGTNEQNEPPESADAETEKDENGRFRCSLTDQGRLPFKFPTDPGVRISYSERSLDSGYNTITASPDVNSALLGFFRESISTPNFLDKLNLKQHIGSTV